MQNSFVKIGDRIRTSAFVVPFGIFLIIASVTIVVISINDFYTSFLGSDLLPIFRVNVNDGSISAFHRALYSMRRVAIALLPQLFTVIGAYSVMALDPENDTEVLLKKGAVAVTIASLIFDIITGYVYYLVPSAAPLGEIFDNSATFAQHFWAFFMSAVVDSLFSEISGAWVWGLLLEISDDFFEQLNLKVTSRLKKSRVPVMIEDVQTSQKRKDYPERDGANKLQRPGTSLQDRLNNR